MTVSRRLLLTASAAAVAGCATRPAGGPPVVPSSEPSAAPTGTASAPGPASVPASGSSAPAAPVSSPAAPAPAAGALVPGTNHAAVATPYTYRAAEVFQWLRTKPAPASKSGTPTPTPSTSASGGTLPPGKLAFLTFDDGPNDVMTGPMLDTLKSLGVPATFFYVAGPNALGGANKALVHRTLAEGHSIAIHSYSHNYQYLYPGRVGNVTNIMADLDKAYAAIRGVLSPEYVTHTFRYPGGHGSWKGLDAADAALAARDMWWFDWNCMSGDAESKPPTTVDAMVAFLDSTLKGSGEPKVAMMLNHDSTGASLTKASLPRMVELLRKRGYSFGVLD